MDAPLVRELDNRAAWALTRFADISDDEAQRSMLISVEELRTEREENDADE
jgi:hypothetical protein